MTNVIYMTPNANVVYDKERDYYSLKATNDIPFGQLIFLEHVLAGTPEFVVAATMIDDELRDTLYPRATLVDKCVSLEDCQRLAQNKLANNEFLFAPDHVLGNVFSKINHHCFPNSHMTIADNWFLNDKDNNGHQIVRVQVYGLWCIRKIKTGDEITLSYVNGGGSSDKNGDPIKASHQELIDLHDRHMKHYGDIRCLCTDKDKVKSRKRSSIEADLAHHFRDEARSLVSTLVDQYLELEDTQDILLLHSIGQHGFFNANGKILCIDFTKGMNNYNKIAKELSSVFTQRKLTALGKQRYNVRSK